MIKQYAEYKVKGAALALFIKYVLPILLILALLFGLVFGLLLIASSVLDDDGRGNNPIIDGGSVIGVSAEVLQYEALVNELAAKYGIPEYAGLVLAMMMQESGGRGNDPMQSSESLCGSVGCITDPEQSIEQGVKYLAEQIEAANGDVKLAVQSYNFGSGFIAYGLERGGYSKEVAIEFSQEWYQKVKHTGNYSCIRPESAATGACYGDIGYVDAVFGYYDYETGGAIGGVNGNFAIPVAGMRKTSDYGPRVHPITGEVGRMHNGVDFGCTNYVTPINSVADGRVVFSGVQGGYGNIVIIQHDTDLFTAYAHNSSNTVRVGDSVRAGQQVAVCGSTGGSTGPHLHLEFRGSQHGDFMNPNQFIGDMYN